MAFFAGVSRDLRRFAGAHEARGASQGFSRRATGFIPVFFHGDKPRGSPREILACATGSILAFLFFPALICAQTATVTVSSQTLGRTPTLLASNLGPSLPGANTADRS